VKLLPADTLPTALKVLLAEQPTAAGATVSRRG